MIQESFEIEQAGLAIRGTVYRPARRQRVPAVLMLHGFTGNRVESGFMFVTLGRALAGRGLAAVAFDCRHSGESDGRFDQMLPTGELDDVLCVLRWLRARPFVDRSRLGVLGFSLGGLLAACAGARVEAFGAMALIAPTTVANLCRYIGRADEAGVVTIGPHTLHPRFFDDLKSLDPLADVVRNPRPTLVVQGTADTAVPPDVSASYARAVEAAAMPLTVEMVEGADHAFTAPAARCSLVDVTTGWLTQQFDV